MGQAKEKERKDWIVLGSMVVGVGLFSWYGSQTCTNMVDQLVMIFFGGSLALLTVVMFK